MERMRHLPLSGVQYAVALLLPLLLALRASPAGAMLVVPLGGAGQGALVNIALRHGGVLLGAGPLPRSLLVYGERSSLEPAFLGAWAVPIAAPPFICGDPPARPGKV